MNFIPSQRSITKMETKCIAGVDVGSDELVCDWGDRARFKNTASGVLKAVRAFKKAKVTQVVVETTGGYERLLVEALWAEKLEVSVVNPERVRNFAKAHGVLAKTDPIDSGMIRLFGEQIKPRLTIEPPNHVKKLQYLLDRRVQLLQTIVAEKNRRKAPLSCRETQLSIRRTLKFLSCELKRLDELIESLIEQNRDLALIADAVGQENCCGRVLTMTLLGDLPELGTLSRRKVAALVGVAPYNNQSSHVDKPRRSRGGRARVRNVLYMATVAAIRRNQRLKAYFLSLVKRGKKKMVALVATMRRFIVRLNSIVKAVRRENPAIAFAFA
jgi:transposase